MFENETILAKVVDACGGQVLAGAACGVTPSIIGRWIKQQHLPRTDYTGETDYAGALASASGGIYKRDWILQECNPVKIKGKKKELAHV
jgi:hypothetical protein